jgi:hypothetical protein
MKYSITLLVSVLSLLGCKGDPGPMGPRLSGNISSSTYLRDDFGNYITNNYGVGVSLDGTSYATVSDSSGIWTLRDIPAGIYDITYYKPGFYKEKNTNVSFVGGGTLYLNAMSLGQIPSNTVSHLDITTDDSSRTINIQGTLFSPDSTYREVVILFSKELPSLSSSFIYEFYFSTNNTQLNPDKFSLSLQLTAYYYETYNLQKGLTLYATAFPASRGGWLPIYVPQTSNYLFDCPGATLSNAVSFVLP